MNVAEISLCKELYELSGWEPKAGFWYGSYDDGDSKCFFADEAGANGEWEAPAYDLGFLLRKLPFQTTSGGVLYINATPIGKWTCGYKGWRHKVANTPEDALIKLARLLFKQNILKRGE